MANYTLMNESKRHGELLDLLALKGSLSVQEMVEAFQVSPATIRRDIVKLDSLGKLKKIRNGATSIDVAAFNNWLPLNSTNDNHYDEKVHIARQAASLCKEGDSVIVNCGSTAFLLGHELCGKNVQVITNYFPLLNYLIARHHANIVVIGGQYYSERDLFLTNNEQQSAHSFAGHYMFTSGSGLTADGLYKADLLSAMVEQRLMTQVEKLVCLVDSSKLGSRVGTLFAPTEQIDIVITGRDADPVILQQLRDRGVQIYLV